jgi:hypothetical protein
MRNSHDNFVNNMAQKLNTKIDRKIQSSQDRVFTRNLRTAEKIRDGYLQFGAIPMVNRFDDRYFTMGTTGTGTMVSP